MTKLYYHKTDGGAEYLCLAPIEGSDEGDLHTAVVRLDGEPELLRELAPEPVKILPKFTVVGMDYWSRRLFKSVKTGSVYVEVDGLLYNMTDEGEPESIICSLDAIEIVKGGDGINEE
jgi:hypothetical protein